MAASKGCKTLQLCRSLCLTASRWLTHWRCLSLCNKYQFISYITTLKSHFPSICLCLAAALRVVPNRSQFFQYESVSLICELQGNSSTGWRIKRNTSKYINKDCFNFCDEIKKSSCYFEDVYPSDTGVYWCESAAGGSSNSVSISVTGRLTSFLVSTLHSWH